MSTLVTNTITGLSTAANITIGSTPVVSASANSLTIRGEGSAQTSIQQGLAKCWVNFNSTSFGISDSFNLTSATDNGTGDYTVTIASDMGNVNYSANATGYKPSATFGIVTNNDSSFFAAGSLRVETIEIDGGEDSTEFIQLCITFHGDLA
jgi:hypothetical protein